MFEAAGSISEKRKEKEISLTSLLTAILTSESSMIKMLFEEYKVDKEKFAEDAEKIDFEAPTPVKTIKDQ